MLAHHAPRVFDGTLGMLLVARRGPFGDLASVIRSRRAPFNLLKILTIPRLLVTGLSLQAACSLAVSALPTAQHVVHLHPSRLPAAPSLWTDGELHVVAELSNGRKVVLKLHQRMTSRFAGPRTHRPWWLDAAPIQTGFDSTGGKHPSQMYTFKCLWPTMSTTYMVCYRVSRPENPRMRSYQQTHWSWSVSRAGLSCATRGSAGHRSTFGP
jgi:hypothetical protein